MSTPDRQAAALLVGAAWTSACWLLYIQSLGWEGAWWRILPAMMVLFPLGLATLVLIYRPLRLPYASWTLGLLMPLLYQVLPELEERLGLWPFTTNVAHPGVWIGAFVLAASVAASLALYLDWRKAPTAAVPAAAGAITAVYFSYSFEVVPIPGVSAVGGLYSLPVGAVLWHTVTAIGFCVVMRGSPASGCRRCGYDLRGLPADAACPECGGDPAHATDEQRPR